MTINELIQGCLRNERPYQRELYLRYSDRAMNIALRYAKDTHEAKDIVHNTFLNVFQKIKSFDPKRGSLENWLSRIVINEALQAYRKQQVIHLDQEDPNLLELGEDPPILDHLQAEDILQLLRKLPDGYRIVFVLSVIEGYRHAEIAKALGITKSASRSQLTRAKKMMRKLILEQKTLEHAR